MMMMMKIYKSPSFISSTEPIALIAQTGKAWLAEIVTSEYFTYFKPANVAGHKDLSLYVSTRNFLFAAIDCRFGEGGGGVFLRFD